MCLPAVPLMLAGTALAAGGQIVGALGTASSNRFAARVANQNAALDRAQAQDALTRGRQEELRQGQRTGALIGQQRAAMAANGIETDYGSAEGLQEDTRQIGLTDAQTIRENAKRESQGYEINAWNQSAQAVAKKHDASMALVKGVFDVGTTLLSSAKQFTGMKVPTGNPVGYEFGPAG